MTHGKLPVIGITGGSGGGKTTVSGILAELGGFIIQTDELSHGIILKGRPAYKEVIACFGREILGADEEIDRKKLGKAVFGKPERMGVLEKIIHPKVIDETKGLIEAAVKNDTYRFAVIDAPLLIEAGMHTRCDAVWLVRAPEAVRSERIMRRDGITAEAAALRMASRGREEDLLPHIQLIIENNENMESLRGKVCLALKNIV